MGGSGQVTFADGDDAVASRSAKAKAALCRNAELDMVSRLVRRGRGDQGQYSRGSEVAEASQLISHDLRFAGGLRLMGHMLVVAAATLPVVLAEWLEAPGGRLEDGDEMASGPAAVPFC